MDETRKRISNSDLVRMRESRDVEGVIEALKYGEPGIVQRLAIMFLGDLGDRRAVEPLIQELSSKDNVKRMEAALSLGDLGDPRAVEPLLRALKDPWERTRRAAALALGKLGDARALEPLIQLLKTETTDVRVSVAIALGNLGDRRAVEPLIQALKDGAFKVRYRAAEALGKLGDRRAVEPLIGALKDGAFEVRRSAAEALGKLGDVRAVERLVPLLRERDIGDEKGEVWRAAAEALDRLGWTPRNDLDKVYYFVAKGEWGKVAELGAVAVKPLLRALHYGWNFQVRVGAAEALGAIGDVRAVERLLEIVEDVNWEDRYRCAAAEALAKIGDVRAVEPLRKVLVRKDWEEDEGMALLRSCRECEAFDTFLVRLCVVKVLGALGWEPKSDEERVYHLVVNERWDELLGMGGAAVDTLLRILVEGGVQDTRYEELELKVLQVLLKMGSDEVIERLARSWESFPDERVRFEAIDALEGLGRFWSRNWSLREAEEYRRWVEGDSEEDE